MANQNGVIDKYDRSVLRAALQLAQAKELFSPEHPANAGRKFWGYHAIFANDAKNPNMLVGVA